MPRAKVRERDGSFEHSAAFGTYGPCRVTNPSWSSFLQQDLHREAIPLVL